MPGDIVVGLDIGTTKVCTVVGETAADGQVEVIDYASVPCEGLRKGVVVDMGQTAEAIRDSVSQAGKMARVDIRSVVVAVTGEHIASLNSRGVVAISNPEQEIAEEDRRQVVEESCTIVLPPDRRILHCVPRFYTVDGQEPVPTPVRMKGSRLEVESHIITAARNLVDNVLGCVQQAGLTLDGGDEGIYYSGLASAEAVLSPEERRQGVALVDLGGGTTDLVVYRNGAIAHSAMIPLGGDHVTNDIAVGLRVRQREAARLKHEEGYAIARDVPEDDRIAVTPLGKEEPILLPRRVLCEIIEPRLEEIVEKVKEEVEAGIGEAPLAAGLVITGAASLLPGAVELAHRIVEWPVRLGVPEVRGDLSGSLSSPGCATGVGLVRLAAARRAREEAGSRDGHLLGGVGRLWRRLFGRKPRRRKRG